MTTAAVAARTSKVRVLFDGQSLNQQPIGNSYPLQLMAFDRTVLFSNVSLFGRGWINLKDVIDKTDRVTSKKALAGLWGVVMNGGTTDYEFNQTGAQVYANMGVCAGLYRSLGASFVIATTTTPSVTITGTPETNRTTGNGLIMADASTFFDGKVDVAADSQLSNANDATKYPDGTHFSAAAAARCAVLVKPALDTQLARLAA